MNRLKLHLMQLFTALATAVVPLRAAVTPGTYEIGANATVGAERLPSNSIIDIVATPEYIWLGTGGGITRYDRFLVGWDLIPSGDQIGRGSVSALMVNDTMLWAATAYTEKVSGEYYPAGGGVGFSKDQGQSWTWLSQPVDPRDVTEYHPTTTNIQNVTYDIALTREAVWIVSWGGGIRRMRFDSLNVERYTWELSTPDGAAFYPVNNLAHRGFSVIYANNSLWIGTAKGIHRTSNEGQDWEHFQFSTTMSPITGDFITAMGVQPTNGISNVWAATWKAEGAHEYYGVCVTEDNGGSWRVALSDSTILQPSEEYLVDVYGPLRVHNFGFSGSHVYAAADGCLWISNDNGNSWGDPITTLFDPTIGETLSDVNFYSAAGVGDTIWVGTDAGLAVGWFDQTAGAFTWRIHRAHQTPGQNRYPETYAYPSPFSPKRDQITRFQVNVSQPSYASLRIFSFAMEPVLERGSIYLPGGGVDDMAGYGAPHWDGRDADGDFVANGVYFYQIKVNGRTLWGKVMVLD